MELRFLGQTPNWRAAAVGPLLVMHWLKPGELSDFDKLETVLAPYLALHGTVGGLTIVDRLEFQPKPGVRPRIEKFAADLTDTMPYSSIVLRCNAVAKILIYAIMNALNLVARDSHPTTVHNSVAAAVEWHRARDPRIEALGGLEELVETVEAFATRGRTQQISAAG